MDPIPLEPADLPPGRHTPYRAWAPMTDAEWATVAPHLAAVILGEGRPLQDARQRIDAIFRVAVSGEPWHALPPEYGKPDTVSRHFRRLARAGLWMRLVGACAARDAPRALRRIEYWACRAARRAMRLLGLPAARMAESLGMLTAMPVLRIFMPRPLQLRAVEARLRGIIEAHWDRPLAIPVRELRYWMRWHRIYSGRPWQARYAPP